MSALCEKGHALTLYGVGWRWHIVVVSDTGVVSARGLQANLVSLFIRFSAELRIFSENRTTLF